MNKASNNATMHLIKHKIMLAALLCLFFPPWPVSAKTIETKLPSGITVSANYHKGKLSQPAVLLLHGFLQTHHSQPMSALASNLGSRGYTTLNPTISLGINKRRQSMACEAVHTHTVKNDVAEIAFWINWLKKNRYKKIVLIGFSSTGDFETLLSSQQLPRPEINKIILTSFNPISFDIEELNKVHTTENTKRNTESSKPAVFSLGYCKKNYTATAKSWLSYAQYDENKALELIGNQSVPVDIIFGSDDVTLPENWIAKIKKANSIIKLHTIENANHFFEGTHEFDLAEQVENILMNIPVQ